MENVFIKGGVTFGKGLPKICVPLTGSDIAELSVEAQVARDLPADLYEWRIDGFSGDVSQALTVLRSELRKPLICTLRTSREGGAADITPEDYEDFLSGLIEKGGFDFIDIELSCGDDRVSRLVKKAREKGIGVIVSKHDFEKTPSEDEMISLFKKMKALGADMPKLAVMPRSAGDVMALLNASYKAKEKPLIAVSMGDMGKISRASGMITGSAVTFAAGKSSSAPGQINAEDLKAILEDLS